MCVCTFDRVLKYFFCFKNKFPKKTYEFEASVVLEEKQINNFLPNFENSSNPQQEEDEESFEIL